MEPDTRANGAHTEKSHTEKSHSKRSNADQPRSRAAVPVEEPTRLQLRTADDIAAAVPLLLGFVPHHSVVMLSLGPARSMHARIDLPHDVDDIDDIAQTLLRPARRNGVREVVVVIYDDDTTVADEMAWAMHEEFTSAGIGVREVLRVHDEHWYAVLPGAPFEAYRGVPFNLANHRVTVQGVVAGHVTHASREELAATLDSVPAAVRKLQRRLGTAQAMSPGALRELVDSHLADGSRFSDAELACVALSLHKGDRRDQAWTGLERPHARAAVELWSDAVRRLPDAHVGSASAVLAFSAWLLGDGALAWCALDRSQAASPGHSLAELVSHLLQHAISPEQWERLRADLSPRADPAA